MQVLRLSAAGVLPAAGRGSAGRHPVALERTTQMAPGLAGHLAPGASAGRGRRAAGRFRCRCSLLQSRRVGGGAAGGGPRPGWCSGSGRVRSTQDAGVPGPAAGAGGGGAVLAQQAREEGPDAKAWREEVIPALEGAVTPEPGVAGAHELSQAERHRHRWSARLDLHLGHGTGAERLTESVHLVQGGAVNGPWSPTTAGSS